MCICNNQAFGRLTEYLRQMHNRQMAACDQITQNITRANRWKLIRIADKNQPARKFQRAQQRFKQQRIHHRRLVDDDRVKRQRILLIALKFRQARAIGKIDLQQAVDCF